MRNMGWWLGFTLVWGMAWAQMSLYIPLDNRPPNWSPCTWELVRCPPPELYKGREGADPQALAQWLLQSSAGDLVASTDALAYGGLVQSRTLELSAAVALQRLEVLRTWKQKGNRVWAFGVIPRHPDSTQRSRNLEVLQGLEALQLDYVEAIWDDALANSPALSEAATLKLPTRPGADEGGQVLLLRSRGQGLRVKVFYDDPQAAGENIRYDGIALSESVRRLVKSVGGGLVETRPDLALVVYTGRNPRQGVLRVLQALREAPVALADLARVNRGDGILVRYLVELGVYANLSAYAAWGTPSNNLGAALAQGGLFAPGLCQRTALSAGQCEGLRQRALGQAYLEYLWGEVGRPWVRARFPEPLSEEAARYTLERLQAEPTPTFAAGRLSLEGLRFPWQRSFEAGWQYRFELGQVAR